MDWLNEALPTLTLVAVLGSGLVAGIFFAFSTFIMKALGRVPQEAGMGVMQAINVTVLNPWFMGAFFGTAIVCLLTLSHSINQWGQPGSVLRLTASLLYLLGTIGVTIVFNVPRNDRLAQLPAADQASAAAWQDYLSSWTVWNHVRTAAALAAAVLFGLSLGS